MSNVEMSKQKERAINIIELSQKLDTFVQKHDLEDVATLFKKDYAVSKTRELKKALEAIEDDARVLKIGIVGRVKAGKSSLLNSLIFDGKSVLPKAATPMTAALTVMEYSEDIEAEVDFFTQEDINDIKEDYDLYLKELEKVAQEEYQRLVELKKSRNKPIDEIELQDKAKKRASNKLKNNEKLASAFDQYSKIKESNIDLSELDNYKNIKANTTEELNQKLTEFVGANGKYMPFTKSVTLKLNEDNLKNIQIIDTPGVNDPVTSREERTKELLKFCDVIFIVSPSGQFLSSEDIDLFDRILKKEGINEVSIISSQVDLLLFADEREKNNAILTKVLDSVTNDLTNQMRNVFNGNIYLKDNPAFVEMLNNQVIYSSGIAYSILKKLDNPDNLDENEAHVLGLLKTDYPDYFSNELNTKENLKLLSNIDRIKNLIEEVKLKKDDILTKKKESFIQAKEEALNSYHKALIKDIKQKVEKIKSSDINTIKKKIESLEKLKSEAENKLYVVYDNLIDELENDLKNKLNKELNKYYEERDEDINNNQSLETGYTTKEVEKDGWLSAGARLFRVGGYETVRESYTYTSVKAGFIRNSIESLTNDIEDAIDEIAKNYLKNYWEAKLNKSIFTKLRETIGDKNIDPEMVSISIKSVIKSIEMPNIKYNNSLPSSLRKTGNLTGSSAEDFLYYARKYVNDLKSNVKNDIKNYINSLITTLKDINLSDNILQKYTKDMELLKNNIDNKELAIEKYTNILSELELIKD